MERISSQHVDYKVLFSQVSSVPLRVFKKKENEALR